MTLIECNGLTMAYDGQTVLQDISFSVNRGDFICVAGQNGSGKTTLMRGLLRLWPLQSGSLRFFELERDRIGYLPQQTVVQRDFPASVEEVVLSGCLTADSKRLFYSRAQKQRAREKMAQLGITDLTSRSYRALSGGQQQRVLLARALCAADQLLLLDEPVNGLDPQAAASLYELLRTLNREQGITILMVSHDLHGALACANKILHLHADGFFFGSKDEYLKIGPGKQLKGGDADAANA